MTDSTAVPCALSGDLVADESNDFDRRFGGLARLYGAKGATRIQRSHAVVVGIGGVGSWTAEAFARSGVSEMTLIDLDHIAPSNVNRQIHATSETFGQAKVLAMRDRIAFINPACKVHVIDDFLSPENLSASLEPLLADLGDDTTLAVVDACDQVRAKVALAAWARDNPVTFIAVGAAGGLDGARRFFHQRGIMTSTPSAIPAEKAASTTNTSGACQTVPKKKYTDTTCWLFSAKAKRVKKTAAFSSH